MATSRTRTSEAANVDVFAWYAVVSLLPLILHAVRRRVRPSLPAGENTRQERLSWPGIRRYPEDAMMHDVIAFYASLKMSPWPIFPVVAPLFAPLNISKEEDMHDVMDEVMDEKNSSFFYPIRKKASPVHHGR
ncbi:MAG: hypothetical protein ACK5PS_12355 [Desulfopila sp.]